VTCGVGKQARSVVVVVEPDFGGSACPDLTQEKDCDRGPCPVHCDTSSWTAWSPCTKTCGSGTHDRTRSVVKVAAHGGYECPELSEMRQCNIQNCAVDCVVSAWATWEQCSKSCNLGTQSRSRDVTTAVSDGGKACPGLTESQTCGAVPCPIDCQVSWYGDWSACDKSCGDGSQVKMRTVVSVESMGGAACPELATSQNCNRGACPADCVMSSWSAYTECSKECAGGFKIRYRNVTSLPADGGKACGAAEEVLVCNGNLCPVSCLVNDWTELSNCSASCGGGV
jgi:hypothetical protein